MAFLTVCVLYCSADGSPLLILRLLMAFATIRAPYCAADGSGLLIPPLVNGFPDGVRTVVLSEWQRIAHSSAR